MEAESIFGLDFDPAEFDQYDADAEPLDVGEEEEEEDEEAEVRLGLPVSQLSQKLSWTLQSTI